MAMSGGMHVAIATWRFRDLDPGTAAAVPAADRLARFLKEFAAARTPLYRDLGIIFSWVAQTDSDSFTTITGYASEEGLRHGVATLPQTGDMRSFVYDKVESISGRVGPMVDIFHIGPYSALRILEERGRNHPAKVRNQRFVSIATWRIREDVESWPDGTDPRTVMPADRFAEFLRSAGALVLVQPESHGMIGGWAVDTGDSTITFFFRYADAQGLASAWAEVTDRRQLGADVERYLDLIERVAGPVFDLIELGEEG
jgi:hypothetical protein